MPDNVIARMGVEITAPAEKLKADLAVVEREVGATGSRLGRIADDMLSSFSNIPGVLRNVAGGLRNVLSDVGEFTLGGLFGLDDTGIRRLGRGIDQIGRGIKSGITGAIDEATEHGFSLESVFERIQNMTAEGGGISQGLDNIVRAFSDSRQEADEFLLKIRDIGAVKLGRQIFRPGDEAQIEALEERERQREIARQHEQTRIEAREELKREIGDELAISGAPTPDALRRERAKIERRELEGRANRLFDVGSRPHRDLMQQIDQIFTNRMLDMDRPEREDRQRQPFAQEFDIGRSALSAVNQQPQNKPVNQNQGDKIIAVLENVLNVIRGTGVPLAG